MSNADVEIRPIRTKKFDLASYPTALVEIHEPKAAYKSHLRANTTRIANLQRRMAAQGSDSLLVIFEGLDASGKDGAIQRIFRRCDPQSCRTFSFQAPDAGERGHEFLWRFNQNLPRRGELTVFNRSHYGDVVVPRVHPEALERLKPAVDHKFWLGRYRSIVEWEAHLVRNGIRIIKIFLHLSAAEQQARLLARIDRREKNWKIEQEDVCDYHRFSDYVRWYEECIKRTHTKSAPWFIVAADDKRSARLMAAQIILQQLAAIDSRYPQLSRKRAHQLRTMLLDESSAEEQCNVD